MLEVGAQEDQAAGAALALGGGDAGLGALDLAFEGCLFPEALGFQEFFFSLLQFLVQGLLEPDGPPCRIVVNRDAKLEVLGGPCNTCI